VRACLIAPLALLAVVGIARLDPPAGLDPPETILDGSEHGSRLFPTFADVDGDGKTDLLVGMTTRLVVYRNCGTNGKPEYARPTWLDDTVPSARIPAG